MVGKPFVLVALLIVAAAMPARAETEGWIFGGVEYSWASETRNPGGLAVSTSRDAIGANLCNFRFWNRGNLGVYLHDSFLFPRSITVSAGGLTSSTDRTAYDYLVDIRISSGPVIRYALGEYVTAYAGIGPHLMSLLSRTVAQPTRYGTVYDSLWSFSMGVDAELGFKVDLSSVWSIAGGVSVAYDPANYSSTSNSYSGPTGKWSSDYSLITANPYLCLGINFYRPAASLGKPR